MIDHEYIASFEEAGSAAGAAYRAFYTAFMAESGGANIKAEAPAASRAFVTYYQFLMTATAPSDYINREFITPEPEEAPVVCGICYCNTCDYLDTCPVYPETEGVYPPPCEACRDKVGPLVPKDGPECGRYTPRQSEDCRACWCRECLAFEECVVEVEGYDPESKPCPCDGCKVGQRFMPKEAPPCDNYIPPCAERVPDEGSAEHDQG